MSETTKQFTKTGFSRLEIKEVDESERTFVGLASTWDLDLGGDVIRKGAFKRTLKHWKDAKRFVPLVDSHNVWGTVTSIVGKMDEGEETDEGLLGTFSMLEDDEKADAVFKRVKGGYVDGLSIGYRAVKVTYPETEEERKEGIYRYLDEVKLNEVSVVMYPMNPNARIDLASAKQLVEIARNRDLVAEEVAELKALRDSIVALLEGGAAGRKDPEEEKEVPSPEEAAVDPERAKALADRIDGLFRNRLATRIETARHSAAEVLVDL